MATALEGLLFSAEVNEYTETRKGVQHYDGNPHAFTDWACRIRAKIGAAKAHPEESKRDHELCRLGSEILDCLSGEAFRAVRDLGDVVSTPYGPTKIFEELENDIIVRKREHADELYQLGGKATGPLARQLGDSIRSYLIRRRRWIDRLIQLDSNYTIPDHIQAKNMLKAGRLTEDQQLFITSKVDEPNFEAYGKEIVRLYYNIHELEKKTAPPPQYGKSQRPYNDRSYKGPRAYQAVRKSWGGKGGT